MKKSFVTFAALSFSLSIMTITFSEKSILQVNARKIQKNIWKQEHKTAASLPSMAYGKPSSSIVMLIDYLKKNNITPGNKVVDIGCGKGRNAIYLVQQGYKVHAFDYITYAIECAEKMAIKNNVADAVIFSVGDMATRWNFPDNFFDLAVDCYSSIDIESKAGRDVYKQELLRTLKPGGYALVTVVTEHDEHEKQYFQVGPEVERYFSVWPQTGKCQKNYDKQELRDFYSEFDIIELKEYSKPTEKLGMTYMGSNYWLLLQKPTS